MARAIVMQAIRTRLADVWSHCPVSYPNEAFQPPADASPFLAVQYPVARQEQISIGAPGQNVFREEGVVRFVLQVPAGSGLDEWTGWLDGLSDDFRAKQFDGVRTYAPSSSVVDDRNRDGGYWALSTAVPYDADFFG